MAVPAKPALPAAIRRLRLWYWAMCLWPMAGFLRTALRDSLPPWAHSGWISFSVPVGMAATAVLIRLAEARIVRRAAAADYRLCPTCLYPLAGESGICPECGEEFTAARARECWAVAEQ